MRILCHLCIYLATIFVTLHFIIKNYIVKEENEFDNQEVVEISEDDQEHASTANDNEEDEDDEAFYSNKYCKNTGIKDLQRNFPTNPIFKCLAGYNCNFSTHKSGDYIKHYETVHLHQKVDPMAICSYNCCPHSSNQQCQF